VASFSITDQILEVIKGGVSSRFISPLIWTVRIRNKLLGTSKSLPS